MDIVFNNPYRILGLLADSTTREKERQINRLRLLIEAEQDNKEDYCFPNFNAFDRSNEDISNASSKLNLDIDKLLYSIFWFYIGNSISDKAELENLKTANLDYQCEIWEDLVESDVITHKNASAFQNYSTFLLLSSTANNKTFDQDLLKRAIELKLIFLESDYIVEFINKITNSTIEISQTELEILFLDTLSKAFTNQYPSDNNKLFTILQSINFIGKNEFLKKYISNPINNIESKIETVSNRIKGFPENAIKIGNELLLEVNQDYELLKTILKTNDINLETISDKLANQFLQCGIETFNLFFEDPKNDVGQDALDITLKAKSFAVGKVAKERIEKSLETIKEFINDKPRRQKQLLIIDDYSKLVKKIKEFQSINDTTSNATDFIRYCKPKLDNIKLILGSDDDYYLELSSRVVINGLGMLIEVVNKAMDKRNAAKELPNAWKLLIEMESYDMDSKQRAKLTENKETLKGIYKRLITDKIFIGDNPVNSSLVWLVGIALFFLIVFIIGGVDGIQTIFGIILFIVVLAGLGSLRR
jgi:hypothetical protein